MTISETVSPVLQVCVVDETLPSVDVERPGDNVANDDEDLFLSAVYDDESSAFHTAQQAPEEVRFVLFRFQFVGNWKDD